jgi:hypothetical protein
VVEEGQGRTKSNEKGKSRALDSISPNYYVSADVIQVRKQQRQGERESTSKKDIGWWIPCLKLFIL